MAFHIHHDNEGDDFPVSAEINVTPFIDIMLVLLIIFMVAAPLATVDVPLDLPVSSAEAQPAPAEPIVMSIQPDRSWYIGDRAIDRAALGAAIDARSDGNHDARIFVRADKTIPYEALMEAMDALRAQGYLKISLVGLDGGDAT
ncbi:TonB system transport protein ExbD [Brevundimonas sp.]|uniref:TonB system transport protein ExbD n=1 Tax=Brevundimonas sp. TaxID=1871086 RepID=UPI003D0FBFEA